jgi:choline dehydrogenase-like flavoprotein
MHIDARELDNNSTIEGDICIIGAGAAGISIALEWISTPYKVILLEGGGFAPDAQVQQLYAGTTSGQKFPPMTGSRLHYFGGTTGHWAGFCSPFDDLDFKKRDWVPKSGWPIAKKDLDPYYERAHKVIQLGPYNYDLEYWRKIRPNFTPLPFDQKIIYPKLWQYNQARFGTLYRDAIITAKNVHLYTYANAVEVKTNNDVSAASKVIIKNHAGKTHTVQAKHFIMACGAIQNTRLLLASNSIAKTGLGNDYDMVGRHFMEHIELASADLYMLKPFPTDLYSFKFGVTKVSAELAVTEEVQAAQQILNGTSSFHPHIKKIAEIREQRRQSWEPYDHKDHLDATAALWRDAERGTQQGKGDAFKSFQMDIRLEQAPNPNSRITLNADRDELGMPRVNLNWELTALEKRSIRTIHYLIGQQIAKSGLGRLKLRDYFVDEQDFSFPDATHGGNHHMGTARMSIEPSTGVVNTDLQVHGIANLYVAGSDCFPTASAVNPTLTLIALALRLSDQVKSRLASA